MNAVNGKKMVVTIEQLNKDIVQQEYIVNEKFASNRQLPQGLKMKRPKQLIV